MNAAGPLLRLTLSRFASHPMRTGLSVLAIAAGVGFVFAVQVINSSPETSFRKIERALGGGVDLHALARSQEGVPDAVFHRIRNLPGVAKAAPLTQHPIVISGRRGTTRVGLIGADDRLLAFNPPVVNARALRSKDESAIGIHLPRRVAREVDAGVGDQLSIRYNARVQESVVASILDGRAGEALDDVSIALAPIGLAQKLTGTDGRITRVAIDVVGDVTPEQRAAIERAGLNRVDVVLPGSEARLFAGASSIERQAASLFAFLTLLIGGLLIYNIAALSAIERHRDISVMRLVGAPRHVILLSTVAESCVIGLAGSITGIAFGRLLLKALVGDGPQHMASAFLINADPIVSGTLVAAVISAGTLATVIGATIPTAIGLRPNDITTGEPTSPVGPSRKRSGTSVAVACTLLVAGIFVVIASPAHTPAAIALLIGGGGLLMPPIVSRAVGIAYRALPQPGGAFRVGLSELRALPGRATALASISAMCLGTIVMIGGSASNLERGTTELSGSLFRAADLWISVAGPENKVGTQPFDTDEIPDISKISGVQALRPFQLTYLDIRGRRALAIGYAPGVRRSVDGTEYVRGDRLALSSGLPRDGDIALSESLANAIGVKLGDRFTLPTPAGPKPVQYVATINNYAWQAGAITMGGGFFADAWGDSRPTMLGVKTSPTEDMDAVKRRILTALGPNSPLRIETAVQGEFRTRDNVKIGLTRVRQIALTVLAGAILALTASSLTAVSQRRQRLAGLRAIGMSSSQMHRALFAEIGFVLLIGAVVGIALGLLGQAMFVSTFSSVGYPVRFVAESAPFMNVISAVILITTIAVTVSVRYSLSRPIDCDLAAE